MSLCEKCKYFDLVDPEEPKLQALCHRYPEEVSTYYDYWCGEWKAKEDNILTSYGKDNA